MKRFLAVIGMALVAVAVNTNGGSGKIIGNKSQYQGTNNPFFPGPPGRGITNVPPRIEYPKMKYLGFNIVKNKKYALIASGASNKQYNFGEGDSYDIQYENRRIELMVTKIGDDFVDGKVWELKAGDSPAKIEPPQVIHLQFEKKSGMPVKK